MTKPFILFAALAIVTGGWAVASELKRFEFQPEATQLGGSARKQACGFPNLQLPADFSIFAAGAYSGRKISFQIDQSGHQGTQIDVAVNSPNKPVVLMLGAYEPTIWNIGWSKETKILGVLVSGYHRQVVAGLEKNVPQLNSSSDNRGACGHFYVTKESLSTLNPLARRVFGRPVDMVFLAEEGKVVVGEPLRSDTKLVTSSDAMPGSFFDENAPTAGPVGLEEAVRKGLLRRATDTDADAWTDAVAQNSPRRDIRPVAVMGIPKPPRPVIRNAYVVLKPFTYPAGLYGAHSATFIVPTGTPPPSGNPGDSAVYDLNTLGCQGPSCHVEQSSNVRRRTAQSGTDSLEVILIGAGPDDSNPCAGNLRFINDVCRRNKAMVLESVAKDGKLLQFADESLKGDRDVVLAAVKQIGIALRYASATMQDDDEIVEAAVMARGTASPFEYASSRLKKDAEFILKLLNKNKAHCCDMTLRYVDSSLTNDKDFMLKALTINADFLQYGGNVIRKDKEIGLFAVKHDRYASGRLFAQLDPTLRDDIAVARAAIDRYAGSYKDVSDRLKKDKDLALAAVKWGAFMWKYVDQSLKDDRQFIETAAALNPDVIEHLDERLRQDKAIVLIAASHSKKAEKLVKGSFRRDREVVLAAIENSEGALPLLLDESFQRDRDFIRSAVRRNGKALRYAPLKFVEDKEIVLAAVRNSGVALAFAKAAHQQDKDIVLAAVKQDWRALAYADRTLRNEPEIVRAAASQNARALIYTDAGVANEIGAEVGVQTASEPLIGEISLVSEHSRVDSSVMTFDGKRIYVLKSGTLSEYQIDPFRLLRSFRVDFDVIQPPERSEWYQIFLTPDESRIVIHDSKSLKLLDLGARRVTQSVLHDSQNGLLVDKAFVTFGSDNVLTVWDTENLEKVKTITPDYKWTGTKEARHHEGSTVTRKFSLNRSTSNVFMLKDMIVIAIPATMANHGTSTSGDLFLINKDTFSLVTGIEHYDDNPTLALDHKYIFVRGVRWMGPGKASTKVETGGFFAMHRYDLEQDAVVVVKPEGNSYGNAARLPFRGLSPNIPPPGRAHLSHGQVLADIKGASRRLYVYENGQAVLFHQKEKTFESTDNARKYLWMKISKDEVIPINDATYNKFAVSGDVRLREGRR